MTIFNLAIGQFDKWMKQNKGTIIDYKEGCLLDNFVVACKRGYAYVFEQYRNANSSDNVFYFIPYKEKNTKEAIEVIKRFEAIESFE